MKQHNSKTAAQTWHVQWTKTATTFFSFRVLPQLRVFAVLPDSRFSWWCQPWIRLSSASDRLGSKCPSDRRCNWSLSAMFWSSTASCLTERLECSHAAPRTLCWYWSCVVAPSCSPNCDAWPRALSPTRQPWRHTSERWCIHWVRVECCTVPGSVPCWMSLEPASAVSAFRDVMTSLDDRRCSWRNVLVLVVGSMGQVTVYPYVSVATGTATRPCLAVNRRILLDSSLRVSCPCSMDRRSFLLDSFLEIAERKSSNVKIEWSVKCWAVAVKKQMRQWLQISGI